MGFLSKVNEEFSQLFNVVLGVHDISAQVGYVIGG